MQNITKSKKISFLKITQKDDITMHYQKSLQILKFCRSCLNLLKDEAARRYPFTCLSNKLLNVLSFFLTRQKAECQYGVHKTRSRQIYIKDLFLFSYKVDARCSLN